MIRIPLAAALALLLAGCGTGFPWGRGPDPNAAEAVTSSAPLVAACDGAFKAWLAGRPAETEGGPTITRVDKTIHVELAAMSTDRMAIDPWRFSCTFLDGQLIGSGPVP